MDEVWREFAMAFFPEVPPLTAARDLGNARAAMLRPRGQPWFAVPPELLEALNAMLVDPPLLDDASHAEWRRLNEPD